MQHLFNQSLSEGKFPSQFLCAKVIPLFMSGSRKEMNNYRPISILHTISKILEKIVNYQVVEYFNSNSFFNQFQFGFRKKHNTQDANNLMLEFIYKNINSKSNVVLTFLDLKKAFDSVNIDILLEKLKYYGLEGTEMNWFASYLKGRSQCVRIGDHISSPLPLNAGVPQGSVLGPTLFNIYINDFRYAHSGTSFQYADDTTILFEDKNFSSLERISNINLESIFQWLSAKLLAPNLAKTVYMLLTNKKRPTLTLRLNNHTLKRVESYKSLGLILDHNLNFGLHCKKVSNSLARINFMLYRNKYFLDRKSKLLLYHSLAYPHLIYNVCLWGSAPKIYLSKVLVGQKRLIRTILGDPRASASQGFIDLGILNVKKIYEHQAICYMFKIIHNVCPPIVVDTIRANQINHSHNTRRRNDIRPPIYSLSGAQKAFSYQGPSIWNKLPNTIKELNLSYTSFSKLNRLYLTMNYSFHRLVTVVSFF